MSFVARLRESSLLCSADTTAILNALIHQYELGLIDENGFWKELHKKISFETAKTIKLAYDAKIKLCAGETKILTIKTLVDNIINRLKPIYCAAMIDKIVMTSTHAKFVWSDVQFMRLYQTVYNLVAYMGEKFNTPLLHSPYFDIAFTPEQTKDLELIISDIDIEIANTESLSSTRSYYAISMCGNVSKCVSTVPLNSSQIMVRHTVEFLNPQPFIANWVISMNTPMLFFPMLFTVHCTNKNILYNFIHHNEVEYTLYFPAFGFGVTLVKDATFNTVYAFIVTEKKSLFALSVFATPVELPDIVRNRCIFVITPSNTLPIQTLNNVTIHPIWELVTTTYRHS